MPAGSTLGAPKGTVVLKPNGAIEKFFSSDAGQTLVKNLQIGFWDEQSGVALTPLPGTFFIHPSRQEHVYELGDGVRVRESTFMLDAGRKDRVDPAIAYRVVEIFNTGDRPTVLSSLCAANLRGSTTGEVRCRYDAGLRAFVAANRAAPRHARLFGCSRIPTSFEVCSDHGKMTQTRFPGRLSDKIGAGTPDPIALFHHRLTIGAHKQLKLYFLLACSSEGVRGVRAVRREAPGAKTAMAVTRKHYLDILGRAVVLTPEPDVNRGVLWAKANMLRTQTYSPTGWCFTNDPTRSSNCVARDTCWYAFGADYVMPEFARESLLAFVKRLERSGKVVEYYDMRNGRANDYGLNINDNTALLIVALWHHYGATGDEAFLRSVYPAARKAARYILSQRDRRGLVWCSAKGEADWGIVGWRNVIQGYRLSGATTELNSECYAALISVSQMAERLKRKSDAATFLREAGALQASINRHLRDPQTGLYYLNIGLDGVPRTDVTCDLVFPVMFRVADHETSSAIIGRLSASDFWTEAGVRTVPRNDIGYSPTDGYGLLGGVWTGVTFWFAFAAAYFNPDFMASSLRESLSHAWNDPGRNNTVPGQFCEWLHGETLANQGMMLSPWFPPRYVWAAIEGAAGLDVATKEPTCNPRLAPEWRWLGVRDLQLAGKRESWFVVRTPETLMYATFRLHSSYDYHAYDEDVTDRILGQVGDHVTAIALRRRNDFVVFFGNTLERTVWARLQLARSFRRSYALRAYNTIRGEWYEFGDVTDRDLRRGVSFEIDRRGFAVVEMTAL
jgi:Bacterial alpha-L-rhamnosidase 6 hairpin glycosidase domain